MHDYISHGKIWWYMSSVRYINHHNTVLETSITQHQVRRLSSTAYSEYSLVSSQVIHALFQAVWPVVLVVCGAWNNQLPPEFVSILQRYSHWALENNAMCIEYTYTCSGDIHWCVALLGIFLFTSRIAFSRFKDFLLSHTFDGVVNLFYIDATFTHFQHNHYKHINYVTGAL